MNYKNFKSMFNVILLGIIFSSNLFAPKKKVSLDPNLFVVQEYEPSSPPSPFHAQLRLCIKTLALQIQQVIDGREEEDTVREVAQINNAIIADIKKYLELPNSLQQELKGRMEALIPHIPKRPDFEHDPSTHLVDCFMTVWREYTEGLALQVQ